MTIDQLAGLVLRVWRVIIFVLKEEEIIAFGVISVIIIVLQARVEKLEILEVWMLILEVWMMILEVASCGGRGGEES